jgi:hypothetical protein
MSDYVGLRQTDKDWYSLIDSSSSLSPKSRVSYKKQLRVAANVCKEDGPYALSTILADPSKYGSVLAHVPDNSRRTYLGALVSLFKRGEEGGFFRRSDSGISTIQGKWSELLQQSSKRYNDRLDTNMPTEREQASHATLSEWNEVFETAYREHPTSQATLILALHALVSPPLRGGDLGRVHIGYTDSGNCAYRDPDDDDATILLVRDHKTSRSHGALKRSLKGRIVGIMRRSAAADPREWLFTTQGGSPYSDSGFSSWKSSVFHAAFGRPVTTNSLRHAYISGIDRQNQSISEARDLASQMGHGLHTQRQYVRFGRG